MNRAQLKMAAKSQIKGKIGILFVITLIISVLSAVAIVIPFVGAIVVVPALALSMTRVYLSLIEGGQPKAGDAFEGFDDFWSAFKVSFLVGLFTFLWSLLFVIPGIVKSFSYSMSGYILAENKGKGALECISESKRMTNGYKMDLFILGLSFIGWILLSGITLGIALIWVMPYIEATYANAYKLLKGNAK